MANILENVPSLVIKELERLRKSYARRAAGSDMKDELVAEFCKKVDAVLDKVEFGAYRTQYCYRCKKACPVTRDASEQDQRLVGCASMFP